MFERFIIGFAICVGMASLSGWMGINSASKDDLNVAIMVLRNDINISHQNEMNVFNSILQRLSRAEKRIHIIPPKKYRITVDGKGV